MWHKVPQGRTTAGIAHNLQTFSKADPEKLVDKIMG